MSNGFFNAAVYAISKQLARASNIQALAEQVEDGFDKLPTEAELKRDTATASASETGAADAYAVASPYPITAYVDLMQVVFRPGAVNTGAATIDVDTVGAKAIVRPDGEALAAGDLPADGVVVLRYSTAAGKFHLMSAGPSLTVVANHETRIDAAETNITNLSSQQTTNIANIATNTTNVSNVDARVTVIETAVLEARVSFYYPGAPVLDDLLFLQVFDASVQFPAGLADSEAYLLTAPTTEALVVEIRKNNTAVGSINVAIGANTATFTFASAVTFDDGDRMSFHVTSDSDDTADTLSVLIRGTPQ